MPKRDKGEIRAALRYPYDDYVEWCKKHGVWPRSIDAYRGLRQRHGLLAGQYREEVEAAPVATVMDTGGGEVASAVAAAAGEDEPEVDAIDAARGKLRAQAQARDARERVAAQAMMEEILQAVTASVRAMPVQQPLPPGGPSPYTHQDREAILVYSDVHVGEKVESALLGGLGGYNQEVFPERSEVLRLAVARAQQTFGAGRLNIFALGDIITGQDIFKGQAYHVDLPITEQVVVAAQRLALDLAYYATIYTQVAFYGVGGNHARTGRKGETPYHVNWDLLVYRLAASMVREHPNITFHLPETWYQVVERQGTTFVLIHGDDIKAWLGIPFYGMERSRTRYTAMLGIQFDFLVVGHHHQPIKTDYILSGGSFVGATEFTAKALASGSRPTQKLLILDGPAGVTWNWDVGLAEWSDVRAIKVYAD